MLGRCPGGIEKFLHRWKMKPDQLHCWNFKCLMMMGDMNFSHSGPLQYYLYGVKYVSQGLPASMDAVQFVQFFTSSTQGLR